MKGVPKATVEGIGHFAGRNETMKSFLGACQPQGTQSSKP